MIFLYHNEYIKFYIQNILILNCNNIQPQLIICQIEMINYSNDFQCNVNQNKPLSLIPYPQNLQAKSNCFYNKLLDFTSSSNMIYVDLVQNKDYLYISDLNMRNNNCSLCKDGMIRIKNVDINTPEFNNIILLQLQYGNNKCGSGCLVISQQQDINYPTRRILQYQLYQTRLNIPFTIKLEQSKFFNNTAQNGIIIVSNLSLSVIDGQFIKNTGLDTSGGILFLGSQNHVFQIMTSEISDSIGNEGGALYLGNKTISNTELLQILLSSNQAKSFGQDIVTTPQSLTISLNGGKTLLQTKQITATPRIIQEIVIKPYRILGNNTLQQFITLPSGYKIKDYQFYDEKLKSYIPYNLRFRLLALNNLKQPIGNLQSTYCTIKKRKINIQTDDDILFDDFVQKLQFNTSSQDYYLDDLIISFDPYLSYEYVLQLQFVCSSIQIPIVNDSSPYNIIGYTDNYELRMNIRTFQCQLGESYNSQLGTCNLCDASQSYYSVTIKASKCSVQDDISMKSVKSTLIELRENYWRPYDDNNIVKYCYNFPVNCKGGWIPGDESCAQGHIGALCEQCDLYNIRGSGSFALSGQFQCSSCSDLSLNTLQIFLIITWTLISIVISVKGNVENVDELIIRMKGIKVGFICVYFERVQIAVLMKILTNYLQIVSSIGTFQLNLPPGLKSMFTFSGNPIKSAMNALDCFLVDLSNIQIIYFRNIWFLFMPIYYSTVIFIIYFLLIQLKYMEFKLTLLSTTLIFIFIYVQPDIIGSFISLLSYRKISQVFWVQGNVSYLYLTPVHAKWLLSFVLPVLILFGFLVPLILYLKMSKFKARLNDTFVLRVYGYLYNEYSKVTYYWEIIKICQKELIIIFLTFYEDTIIIKGTIVFLIIFCYDVFSKRFKPYKRVDLNKLDSQSSSVCGFSIVLGMAIYYADQYGNIEILWPFYLLIGLFNLYFLIRLLTLLIIGYLEKLADQIDQIRDYINDKYPIIGVKYPQLQKYLENSKIRSKRVKERFQKLRVYLWKKVEENLKSQRPVTDKNQEIEKKESIQYFKQYCKEYSKELKNDANQSNEHQSKNEKSKKQSVIAPQDIDQEKINISLDIQKINNRQSSKFQQDSNKEKSIKNNKDSYESIPIEIYSVQQINLIADEEESQNNKDDEEQLNSFFEQ
ncbi:hypothetical protein pb186bvf_018520 [Paramecium bursaria]